MEKLCPSCDCINSLFARFCEQCNHKFSTFGTVVDAAREASAFTVRLNKQPLSIPVEGERKTVTAVFVDIKSSVELMANMDAEEAQNIVDPALQIMLDATLFYDGYVVHTLGDGILAMFGAPIAFEDHARRATYAAIEMQRALRSYALQLVRQGKPGLEVRVGINTGEAVLRALNTGGRLEYNPIGHTINLAARLQTMADSGSVVISDSTRRLVEGYFELKPLPPALLKGVKDPVAAFEAVGLGAQRRYLQVSMTRGFIKLVNREREMQDMQRVLALAMSGRGQVVAEVSEAGAGKSRLLFEFTRSLPPECRIIEAYALSHVKAVPWVPVVDMLTTYFEIRSTDEASTRRQKVCSSLMSSDPSLLDALPYLYELLGIAEANDPLNQTHLLIKRARSLDAIKRVIITESRKQPLVFVFEDLHWADAQSRSLLDLLVDGIAEARILLIVSYRPDFDPAWRGKQNYSEIVLKPLDVVEAEQLLSALVHDIPVAPPLKKYIIERADGNPFFLEESVRSLRDDGILTLDADERPARADQLRVPETIQATLAARIDRLPAHLKELLQTLSVVGSRLPLDLVASVTRIEATRLDGMLVELQNSDFIYAQTTHDQTTYAFRHILTQEVTYQSLLASRRRRLHEAVGGALESIYASSLNDHIGELAYHYSRSNDTFKAVEYLGRLGELAIRRSAHAEAADSIRAAMGLVEALPDDAVRWAQESRLWLALGVSLQTGLGYAAPEVAAAYEKATALSERTGDVSLLASAITGHSIFSIVRADYKTAFRLAERLSILDDPEEQHSLVSLMLFGLASAYTGQQKKAEEYFVKALAIRRKSELVETIQLFDPSKASCLSYLAVAMLYLGYPDAAFKYSEEAIALAQKLAIPITLVQAQGMHGLLCHAAREFQLAEKWIDKAIAGAIAGGFPYWQMLGSLIKASLLVEGGQSELGLLQFDRVYRAYRQSGARIGEPWLLALHGEMLAKVGQYDQGLLALEEALACVEETGERYHEAEIHRLKGELLLLQRKPGAPGAAEACFLTSLELARTKQAKMLELRAATSLAKLYTDKGREKEAFDALGTVYAWFDEGLESRELKDVSDLLIRLSGLL
jgi:class 3 adenylate cyclase/tetratricopeptide (TPR) repeat protein